MHISLDSMRSSSVISMQATFISTNPVRVDDETMATVMGHPASDSCILRRGR